MSEKSMNLNDAQRLIERLSNDTLPDSAPWRQRAAMLVSSLLPVLAWPGPEGRQIDRETVLDIERLIARANLRSGNFADIAWEGLRHYLDRVPGLGRDANGTVLVSGTASIESIREHHGYVTMQLHLW
jgi:hypothetical protein